MTLPTNVNFVTIHAYAVLEVVILNVPLVTMELIGMKENVEPFAQLHTGKMMMEILVIDVMEVVSLVPEEPHMIVKNHAQKVFTGISDNVSVLAQIVHMNMTPQLQLVKIVT
jgi:hypothetical protein